MWDGVRCPVARPVRGEEPWRHRTAATSSGTSRSWSPDSWRTMACRILPATVRVTAFRGAGRDELVAQPAESATEGRALGRPAAGETLGRRRPRQLRPRLGGPTPPGPPLTPPPGPKARGPLP